MDGAPDQGLLKKKGGRGFPYCTIMNTEGEVIWEARPTSLAAVEQAMASAKMLQKLRAKAAANPQDLVLKANAEVLAALGNQQRKGPSKAALKELAKTKGLDAQVLKAYREWAVGDQIMSAFRGRSAPKKVYALLKQGTTPPASFGFTEYFYMFAAQGAVAEKDAALAKTAFGKFDAIVKKMPDDAAGKRMRKELGKLKKQIAGLKDSGK